MNTKEVVISRDIKIWSSIGTSQTINTSATTWGQLEPELRAKGIDTSKMTVMHGTSRVSYQNPAATLDMNPHMLFLMPKETKSGGETRDAVKELIAAHGDLAKDWFNDGQNYTRKKEADLEVLLTAWKKKYKKGVPAQKSKAPAKAEKKSAAPKKSEKKAPAKKAATSGSSATKGLAKKRTVSNIVHDLHESKVAQEVVSEAPKPVEFPSQEEMDRMAKELSKNTTGVKIIY